MRVLNSGTKLKMKKAVDQQRLFYDLLAETESTSAQVKHWMAWRDADRGWLVDLPEITSENGNK